MGVRPAGAAIDSDPGARIFPGLRPRSSKSSLRPWMCHHTWEPTVLSRTSVPPGLLNFNRFHQPCLLPRQHSVIVEDWHLSTWRPLTFTISLPHLKATVGFWTLSRTDLAALVNTEPNPIWEIPNMGYGFLLKLLDIKLMVTILPPQSSSPVLLS